MADLTLDDFLGKNTVSSDILSPEDFGIISVAPQDMESYSAPGGDITVGRAMDEASKLAILKGAGVRDFVPLGVKDTPYRRETITAGNKAAISNVTDSAILKGLGVDVPPSEEPKSLLQQIFKVLDYPGSQVREVITGMPAEEGNQFSKALRQKFLPAMGVPVLEESEPVTAKSRILDNLQKTMGMLTGAGVGMLDNRIPKTNVLTEFGNQFARHASTATDPAWIQNRAIDASGLSMDILTDPLSMLGPGIMAKKTIDAPRTLAALRTPSAFGVESKFIPLTPRSVDRAANSLMEKVGSGIASTRVGRVLGKAFVPGFGLPDEYYNMHRDQLDKMNFEIQNLYKAADEAFKGLSEAELKAIPHIIEGTLPINSIDPARQAVIQTAVDGFKSYRDIMTNRLKTSGVLKASVPFNDEYVPHIYPGTTEKEWIRTGPFSSITESNPFFTKQRTHATLADSIAAGNAPMESADDILKFWGSSGVTEMGKRELIEKTVNNFGTRARNITQAQTLLNSLGPDHAIYAPKGTMNYHKESYIPKSVMRGQGNLIQVDINDLKQGMMLSKNVPVYVLPKSIADDMNRIEKVFGNEESSKGLLRVYDNALKFWKGRVTVTSPGFHLRNAYSNVANAYLGGLEDFSRYTKAAEVASDKQGRFAGRSYAQIKDLARRYGVYSPTAGHWMKEIFGPEMIRDATPRELMNPLGQRFALVEEGRKVGSAIENNSRLALFMDRLAKGDTPIKAAMHSKKYLFDYSELTPFEQQIMKRTIPFYTWMRKNIALQGEGLLTNPKAAGTIGKITGNYFGEYENKPPLGDLPRDMQSPLAFPISSQGKAPIMTKLDLPVGDLDGKKMGLSPIITIASEAYNLIADKDKADKHAPELLQLIHENLPAAAQDAMDLKKVDHKFTNKKVVGMDPRVQNILAQVSPLLMRTSRLIPTDGNLADPAYQKRLSSFLIGVPIQVVDLKEQQALRRITTKAVIGETIKRAQKEGTVNPLAISIMRQYFKLK